MEFLRAFASLFSGLSKRQPAEDSWVLPGNEVTRAIESGRDLAQYTAVPETRAPRLELPPISTFDLPPLAEPAPRIVISDDVVHGAPISEELAPASEKPLEPKTAKKRWWRRAA